MSVLAAEEGAKVLVKSIGVVQLRNQIVCSPPASLILDRVVQALQVNMREGGVIVGYSLFGVAPAAALAVSIAFGIALLVASLPGALFIRLSKEQAAPAPVPAEGRVNALT